MNQAHFKKPASFQGNSIYKIKDKNGENTTNIQTGIFQNCKKENKQTAIIKSFISKIVVRQIGS